MLRLNSQLIVIASLNGRSAFRMLEFFELNFVLAAFINFLAPACSNCSAKKIAVSSHPNITPLQVVNSPLIFRATRIAAAARDVGPSEIFVSFFHSFGNRECVFKDMIQNIDAGAIDLDICSQVRTCPKI